MFPLTDRLPSTTSATPPWALFGSFTGTTRPSDFSRSCITGLRPWPSPHDPPLHHDRRMTVRSPGSQHEEITRMLGFSDPAGSADGSRKTPPTMLPSAEPQHVGTPRLPISRLNSPACAHPETNASLRPHGTPTHGQGHRDSLDLRCRTLSFPSSCRLSGAFVTSGLSATWAARHRQGHTKVVVAYSKDHSRGGCEALCCAVGFWHEQSRLHCRSAGARASQRQKLRAHGNRQHRNSTPDRG
jgi:hypothetical protein